MEAAVSFEPALDDRVFTCRVISGNEAEIEVLRGFPVDLF